MYFTHFVVTPGVRLEAARQVASAQEDQRRVSSSRRRLPQNGDFRNEPKPRTESTEETHGQQRKRTSKWHGFQKEVEKNS